MCVFSGRLDYRVGEEFGEDFLGVFLELFLSFGYLFFSFVCLGIRLGVTFRC